MRVSMWGAVIFMGVSWLMAGSVAAQQPLPECDGSGTSATVGGGSDDASGIGQVVVPRDGGLGQALVGGIVNGVVNGSQWMGDAYGRNVPADWWGWAPGSGSQPPAAPPPQPQPTSTSSPGPYGYGLPYGDPVARGAWNLGTWAGTPSAPQPAPQTSTPPSVPSSTGVWTQPMHR